MPALHIRPARMTDLPAIMHIQQQCYTAIVPESAASMGAKMEASPTTCLIATSAEGDSGDLWGYFLAVPWRFNSPPQLNQSDCILPPRPDCLYLHDLAIAPAQRGTGAGHALVQRMLAVFHASTLERACLVAIQNAIGYWRRQGFEAVPDLNPSLRDQLATYGTDAQYMQLHRI